MAELIEVPFGLWTRVGTRNRVLDGGPDRPMRRGNFLGERTRQLTCRGGKCVRSPPALSWHYRPQGTSAFVLARGDAG